MNRASTVTPRSVERRWLRAAVEVRNPTATAIDLEGVRCRVLLNPDGGQPHDASTRGSWRIRLEPGASYHGEVAFYKSGVSAVPAPVALAEPLWLSRARRPAAERAVEPDPHGAGRLPG